MSILLDFASRVLEKFGSKFFTRKLAQPRCSQMIEEERGCHTANNGCVKTSDIRNHLSATLSSGWCRNYQTEVSVTSIPFPSVSDFLLFVATVSPDTAWHRRDDTRREHKFVHKRSRLRKFNYTSIERIDWTRCYGVTTIYNICTMNVDLSFVEQHSH